MPYNIPQQADLNAAQAAYLAQQVINGAGGLGGAYNQFVQRQVPQAADQFRNQAALAALAYTNPGTSYGYTIPTAAAIDKLWQPNRLESTLVANQNNSLIPLAAMAAAQQAIQDRQAQGAALSMQGIQGATEMQQRALNAPISQALVDPSTVGDAALQNQALQQGQYELAKNVENTVQSLPQDIGVQLVQQRTKEFGAQPAPLFTAQPSQQMYKQLGIDASDIDQSGQNKMINQLPQISQLVGQARQDVGNSTIVKPRVQDALSSFNTLMKNSNGAPTTSNALDWLKGGLAQSLGDTGGGAVSSAATQYSNQANQANALALVNAITSATGDTDPSALQRILPHPDNNGNVVISPQAIQSYLKSRVENLDRAPYAEYTSQQLFNQATPIVKNYIGAPGLIDPKSTAYKQAAQMQKEAEAITKPYTQSNGMVKVWIDKDDKQTGSIPVSDFYIQAKQQGMNAVDIKRLLNQVGVPTNAKQ